MARSAAGSQLITGPVLVLGYRKTIRTEVVDPPSLPARESVEERAGTLHFLPATLQITSELDTEVRKRGIFPVDVYRTVLKFDGAFELAALFGITEPVEDLAFRNLRLSVGISDIRGIVADLKLQVDGEPAYFQPGPESALLSSGIHVPLPLPDLNQPRKIPFSFSLELIGTEALRFIPVGRNTQIEMSSKWPHPGFIGEYLPVERNISGAGFTTTWKTTSIITNLDAMFASCRPSEAPCAAIEARHLGVSLIDPVNNYTLSERATKHSLLFIVLTFAGFFIFEVMKQVRVHPVQYAFVGAGLVVFYLLLISLSEHNGFAVDYLLSSLACITLITTDVRSVFGSTGRALILGAGLSALYGALYCVLNAEDFALLMGSALLFGVLAAAMMLTRKVDWSLQTKPEAS
ncbi:MAG: cell envelope integrity protein CreD [Gammaproteobacteria bacterium]|nr:cell envelope integrity protein CreD [Gammaproteobacteria bacterium]